MSKIPEIRIYHSFLLAGRESKTLAGDHQLRTYQEYSKDVVDYKKHWKKYEKRIIKALQDAVGLKFYKSVIDVACAPYFIPKSEPLIMSYYSEPDQFVDVLTHELSHVLLTDNDILQIRSDNPPNPSLNERWVDMYGDLDSNVLAHIPVHAMSKHIYVDILNEESRLERDKEMCKKWVHNKPYVDAWDYVEAHGYMEIIERLKKMYADIKNEN